MNEGAGSKILALGRQIGGDSKVKATQGLRTLSKQTNQLQPSELEAVKEI